MVDEQGNEQPVVEHAKESDEALMLAYAQGDLNAFECLYERHKGGLYRFFIRQIKDAQLAEDLYQELWSRIIKSTSQYQPSAQWTTWAYRIAHNLAVDHFRRVNRAVISQVDLNRSDNHSLMEDDTDALISQTLSTSGQTNSFNTEPDRLTETQQLAHQLKYCIEKLPAAQKEVFLLSEETSMSVQMISEVVSVSFEAVKSRIRYAKAQLQTCLSYYKERGNRPSENEG